MLVITSTASTFQEPGAKKGKLSETQKKLSTNNLFNVLKGFATLLEKIKYRNHDLLFFHDCSHLKQLVSILY